MLHKQRSTPVNTTQPNPTQHNRTQYCTRKHNATHKQGRATNPNPGVHKQASPSHKGENLSLPPSPPSSRPISFVYLGGERHGVWIFDRAFPSVSSYTRNVIACFITTCGERGRSGAQTPTETAPPPAHPPNRSPVPYPDSRPLASVWPPASWPLALVAENPSHLAHTWDGELEVLFIPHRRVYPNVDRPWVS